MTMTCPARKMCSRRVMNDAPTPNAETGENGPSETDDGASSE